MTQALPKPLPVRGRRKIDHDAVVAALNEVNGRAEAHALTSFRQIDKIAERAEARLAERGLPVKYRDGVRIIHVPSGPGKAYARRSSTVVSTEICLERLRGTWCLTSVAKCLLSADCGETFHFEMPRAAIGVILRQAVAGITPREAPDGSFEKMDLGSFIHEVSQIALPETPSNHQKMSAVAIVDGLISSGYARPAP